MVLQVSIHIGDQSWSPQDIGLVVEGSENVTVRGYDFEH